MNLGDLEFPVGIVAAGVAIALFGATIAIPCYFVNANDNAAIVKMVQAGADPVHAACATGRFASSSALCQERSK